MNFIKKIGKGIPFNMIFGLRDFQLLGSLRHLVANSRDPPSGIW